MVEARECRRLLRIKSFLFKELKQFPLSNVFMIWIRTGKDKTAEDLETSHPRWDSWNQYIFLKFFVSVVFKRLSSELYAFDCFFKKKVSVLMKLRAFYFLFCVKIFLFPLWDSKTSLPDVLKATLVLLFYNKFTSANMCVHVFVCVCLHVYLWVCVCEIESMCLSTRMCMQNFILHFYFW